ncbi:hypothetical protein JKY79_02720 [Candidatus Babeliales bacterium]|nr:hypothetical protein [Candidatus Babeliales bacterium]
MNNLLIPQLKKLVSIDTSIRALMQQMEKRANEIEETKKALVGASDQIDNLHQAKEAAKKTVNIEELESQSLRDQEISIRESLNNIKSTKEYELKNKELILVSDKRLLLDDVIIKVWHDLEGTEKKLAQDLPGYIEKHKTLVAEKIEREQSLSSLTEQLDELEKERIEASKVVPEKWLTKYTRMRLLVDDPIIPLSSTHCSACFYSIPRQEISNLKRDALIICRNCYRFIYRADEEKPTATIKENQITAELK